MAKGTWVQDIEVRWGDLDAFNHVNNTLFLRYLEETRIRMLSAIGSAWKTREQGPVVANININFRREIRYPATVRVTLTARAASEKRLVLSHTITDQADGNLLYADAEITMVWIDLASGRSIPIPEAVVRALPPAPPAQ